uniref:Glycosyltransferase family 20 protein n=1 Tax=Bionectria ochroleuca TaxID=29856 RepID=A0A8H7NIU7_BIOOC
MPATLEADGAASPGRLLLLSNRLPITIKRSEDGSYSFSMSSGGLVTGLSGLSKTTSFQWYGWPGLEVPENEAEDMTKRLKDEYGAHPVFIDDELADRHYNGFSNSILWPLFHYHPGEITFDESAWDAYQEVNRLFAKAVIKDVQDGDLIWVHDYHLMLLPQMLREEIGNTKKNVRIGFFLHTPFPSSEIYRILPVREQLLTGLLDCDLIGFHTYDYARHFLSSCSRILGTPTTPNGVDWKGRYVTIGAFPIGSILKSSSRVSRSPRSKSASLRLAVNLRESSLSSVSIVSITSRESPRSFMHSRSSLQNIQSGSERLSLCKLLCHLARTWKSTRTFALLSTSLWAASTESLAP